MGQSGSTSRQKEQDLTLFSSSVVVVGNEKANNESQQQETSITTQSTSSTSGTTRSKKNQKSPLFQIPVDTFVLMSQFLTVHQVVHQLTLIHPIIYDIMYHPHNVDSLWNNRNVDSLDDMFMFNLEAQYMDGVMSFIDRVKVQRARIHLREWNEDSTINILKKLQTTVQEMHITAFEIRFKVAVTESKWTKLNFDKLRVFSCQNQVMRQEIICRSPQLEEYREFRVHNDTTFNFQALLDHKDLSKYQVLAIRGNTNGTFSQDSAGRMADFISKATNLTELDLCISIAPATLLLNAFRLKNLKSFSLRGGTYYHTQTTIIDCNNPQLAAIELPEHFTKLALTNISDTNLMFFLINKMAPQLQDLTLQRCYITRHHDMGPKISLPELLRFTSLRCLFRSQIRFLLSQSKKLQYFNFQDAEVHDATTDLDTLSNHLSKQLKEVIYHSVCDDATNVISSINHNISQVRIDHTAPRLHFFSNGLENVLRLSGATSIGTTFGSLRSLRELRLEKEITWHQYGQLTKSCDQLRKLRLHSLTGANGAFDVQVLFFLETLVLDASFTQLNWDLVLLLAISCGPQCTSFTTLAVNHAANWNGKRKAVTFQDIRSIFNNEQSHLVFNNPSQKENLLEWYESAFHNNLIPGAARSLNEFIQDVK